MSAAEIPLNPLAGLAYKLSSEAAAVVAATLPFIDLADAENSAYPQLPGKEMRGNGIMEVMVVVRRNMHSVVMAIGSNGVVIQGQPFLDLFSVLQQAKHFYASLHIITSRDIITAALQLHYYN